MDSSFLGERHRNGAPGWTPNSSESCLGVAISALFDIFHSELPETPYFI